MLVFYPTQPLHLHATTSVCCIHYMITSMQASVPVNFSMIVIYSRKMFITLTPWANVRKLFTAVIYECS
jgi:hypothetical protein